MSIDVRKTAKDAGYVTVGIGVIAAQQAQLRRRAFQRTVANQVRETQGRINSQAEDVVRDARAKVTSQAGDLRARTLATAQDVQEGVANSTVGLLDRAQPLVDELRLRVEPLLVQLQAVPDQLSKAVETGRDRVQQLLSRAA